MTQTPSVQSNIDNLSSGERARLRLLWWVITFAWLAAALSVPLAVTLISPKMIPILAPASWVGTWFLRSAALGAALRNLPSERWNTRSLPCMVVRLLWFASFTIITGACLNLVLDAINSVAAGAIASAAQHALAAIICALITRRLLTARIPHLLV
jgi:branched-subunit amino acid transport protein